MEFVQDKGVLLSVDNPQQVTQVIPKSQQINDEQVFVYWGLEETQVLRNIGIEVPSPIERRYKWPGQLTPFEHQKKTSAFLTLNKRAFCFSEQGTGKSASVIWASDYLMRLGLIRRVLIICPLSIMDSAWRGDLFKTVMHRHVDMAHGSPEKRRRIIEGNAEYVIINYGGVSIVQDEIAQGEFDLFVIDEANHYKTITTKRWKTLNKLLKPDTWLWMLTGTPAAQSPADAYGLAKLANPNSVPRFYSGFRDQVMYRVSQFKWVPKPNAKDVVHRVLQPAIRYTKEECLDLPDMLYTKRDVELTRQQKKYYKRLKNDMLMRAAEEEVTAANAAVAMNKMLQLASGCVYTDKGEILEFDISNRYKVLREVMDETEQKILVFAPFRHVIDMLLDKLAADGVQAEGIHGGVPVGRRNDIFRRFQNSPDPRVLVIQPQAAAHGVTLTAANTVVWWGPVSSLETYAQANARVHRQGQQHHCTVVQLQGAFVEQYIYNMLDAKIDEHSQIVDLYKQLLE